MWRVVYIAHNHQIAEQIRALLTREGFLANIRPASVAEGAMGGIFEVLVPPSEVEDASETIQQMLSSRSGPVGHHPGRRTVD